MAVIIRVVLLVATALLLLGVVTGRVRMSSCCGIADPRRDLRMRDAFVDDEATGRTS